MISKAKNKSVYIINGPNLGVLGYRQTEIYGSTTHDELELLVKEWSQANNLQSSFFQNDAEHELINTIHQAREEADAIIINAGGFSHTSVAIRDALDFAEKPIIEIHISNIFARESFRHKSYISDIATGVICGLGIYGYKVAIDFVAQELLP